MARDQVEQWSTIAVRVLAPNPGAMTLDGTNTFVLRVPGSRSSVVVDPGPDDASHLDRISELGSIQLILLTHRHLDHSESAARLSRETDAPVRGADPTLCVGGAPLLDGERITEAGLDIRVIGSPGHSSDSVCFHLTQDRLLDSGARGTILTGDTILGRGTTVIARPDGSLADYLTSLKRLAELESTTVFPGHGPRLDDASAVAGRYLIHRQRRLRQVADALASLATEMPQEAISIAAVTDLVYSDAPASVRRAAEMSVAAQLEYLEHDAASRREGRTTSG